MSTIALFPDGRPSRVATLAGEASEPVGMARLLQAAHSEGAKRVAAHRYGNAGVGMTRVIVHIDRFVLKGFRHEDRHAITAGLRQELGRVFADREAVSNLRAMGDVSRLRVGGVHIEHGTKPQRVGENVARRIGKEIKK